MSDAVRDVTIRVAVDGMQLPDLTKFQESAAATDRSIANMQQGFSDLHRDITGVLDVTNKYADAMNAASRIDLGSTGIEDLKTATEDVAQAQASIADAMNDLAGKEVGDLGMAEAATSAEEAANNLQEVADAAADLGKVDVGAIISPEGINTATAAVEELNHQIDVTAGSLGKAANAAADLASDGGQVGVELADGLATAAEQAENLAKAETEAKEKVVDATKESAAATATEQGVAEKSVFKKIQLSERLAAFNRKSTEDFKKQEAEKAAASKKSGEEQRQHMFAASGAIAQSLAAGTQFIATLKLIAGESPEIEELAKQFAKVQGIVQGVAAGTQAFTSINQGLASLQAAAGAATAQLALTGGTATATQGALIRLAPAAAMAQAALGPIAIAVAGIALAVTALEAVSSYFSFKLPNDSERNARQFEKVNEQLDNMKRKIEANSKAMHAANDLLRSELELRKMIAGETTGGNVMEEYEISVNTAAGDANNATRNERIAAKQKAEELRQQRNALVNENEALNQKDTEQASWWGGDGKDPAREKRKRQISQDLEALNPQIQNYETASEGTGVKLSAETMSEYAAAIENLPQEQQAAYESVLSDFQQSLVTAVQSANSELTAALQENQSATEDNTRQQDELRRQFEEEQNIALRLQSDPTARQELEQNVQSATVGGDLNAGIDALSGTVSGEREQELRNQLAEGNLTREKLLAEIADAAEFETEKAELDKQVKALQEQAKAIAATREELTAAQNQVRMELNILHEEIRQTQQAQQQR